MDWIGRPTCAQSRMTVPPDSRGFFVALRVRHMPAMIGRMNYANIITLEPGKRGGKPCIRGLRVTVYDVLENLASGMSHEDILREFPYLTDEDIRACLAYAADRERKLELQKA